MYLSLKHEVIGPLLAYLDEVFETFTCRMISATNVPVLPNDGLTSEKMQAHPHVT